MLALLIAFGLKHHYSHGSSEDLCWMLLPTASVVEQLSGIQFEREADTGFVDYEHRIIIAPACAGINFMIIAFCMALFSNIHRFQSLKSKLLWLGISLAVACIFTIGINALRIIAAIHLYKADIYVAWFTPQRIHRIEGIFIYFLSLTAFFWILCKIVRIFTGRKAKTNAKASGPHAKFIRLTGTCLNPFFWYCLIALGVPLLNHAYRQNGSRFGEHCWMVIAGCLAVFLLVFSIQVGWQHLVAWIKHIREQ